MGKCFLKKIVILLIALGGLLVTGCAVLTNGLSGSLYIESSKVQQIIDKAEYPAKRMQELKDDPVGAPLVKSYEMFAALMEQKNMDSSLVDSMRLSRRAFFEPWKRVSDSICNSASGELSLEIRAVYEAAFRFGIESDYDYLLKEQDSLHYEERKDVSFEDKVEFLKLSRRAHGCGALPKSAQADGVTGARRTACLSRSARRDHGTANGGRVACRLRHRKRNADGEQAGQVDGLRVIGVTGARWTACPSRRRTVAARCPDGQADRRTACA